MTPTLCITRWSETFENADTRKRERLKFFHSPSGCDSNGYLELMTCHQSAGVMAFGIFQALCQHSATLPAKSRGKFVKSNGSAMNLTQIALLIRVEPATLEKAVQILTSQEIGWLHWIEEKSGSATNLPPTCQSPPPQSADEIPPTAGFVQGEGQGKGQGQGEGEERTPAELADAQPQEPSNDDWSGQMPTETARDFAKLEAWINSLHPSWKKRPHLTRIEREELMANSKIFFDLTDRDKDLLARYMDAAIEESWGKFWQPDHRGQLVRSVMDVLSHADRWERECRKRKVPTGLEVVGGAA
jgi:hypothetical protein